MELNRRSFLKGIGIAPLALLPSRPKKEVEVGPNLDGIFWTQVYKRVDAFEIKAWGTLVDDDHPAFYKTSHITFNHSLVLCEVARQWGITPGDFDRTDEWNQIEMCAWYIATTRIYLVEDWDYKLRTKRQKR